MMFLSEITLGKFDVQKYHVPYVVNFDFMQGSDTTLRGDSYLPDAGVISGNSRSYLTLQVLKVFDLFFTVICTWINI